MKKVITLAYLLSSVAFANHVYAETCATNATILGIGLGNYQGSGVQDGLNSIVLKYEVKGVEGKKYIPLSRDMNLGYEQDHPILDVAITAYMTGLPVTIDDHYGTCGDFDEIWIDK